MSARPDKAAIHLTRRALVALPLALLSARVAHAKAEPLDPDEDVLFLPGVARQLEDGRFEVDIHAWVHEKDRHRILDVGLARYLGLRLRDMNPVAQARFAQRTSLFHAEPEEGTVIEIDFGHGSPALYMPSSDAAGRTNLRATVALSPDASDAPWLRFVAVTPGPRRNVEGRALIVPDEGVSVVSDIDDTIKKTQVRDQKQMLLNTFARTFEAAPGMAAHYRRMAINPQTRFHYVSSSPMQLVSALDDFIRRADFPPGSLHLRESTTLRTLIPDATSSRDHKMGAITQLLQDFPRRRLLLVGDSGEADPEIYADVARAHPQRIEGIVIRDVTGEGRGSQRYATCFESIDPARWHIYADGDAWPVVLP